MQEPCSIGRRPWEKVAFLVALILSTPVSATSAQWKKLATGVELHEKTYPGPNRVKALRVDLCAAGVRVRATAHGERGRTTSSWASARANMVAAVNGGFFETPYKLAGGYAWGDGKLWPGTVDTNFRGFFAFGPSQLEFSESALVVGAPGWAEDGVSGDATLVRGGKAVYGHGGVCPNRNPQTIIGYTKGRKKLFLVTVDGRSSSSVGMTCAEASNLMVGLGANAAMRLDGGGSSTFWVRGRGVINRPSDGVQRVVANHIGVVAFGDGPPRNCLDRKPLSPFLGVLRKIPSAEALFKWGFRFEDMIPIPQAHVDLYGRGPDWPAAPDYVRGTDGSVYSIEFGMRREATPGSGSAWRRGLQNIEDVTDDELSSYLEGPPLTETPFVFRHGDDVFVEDHPARYRAIVREASYPSETRTDNPEQRSATVRLEIQNAGSIAWAPGEVRIESTVLERTVATVDEAVPSTGTTSMSFSIPFVEPGDSITECLRLVGDVPFDAPGQGGTLGENLCFTLRVTGPVMTGSDANRARGYESPQIAGASPGGTVTGSCAVRDRGPSTNEGFVLLLLTAVLWRTSRRSR